MCCVALRCVLNGELCCRRCLCCVFEWWLCCVLYSIVDGGCLQLQSTQQSVKEFSRCQKQFQFSSFLSEAVPVSLTFSFCSIYDPPFGQPCVKHHLKKLFLFANSVQHMGVDILHVVSLICVNVTVSCQCQCHC